MDHREKHFPDTFIVGSPKCGTTTIASWLSDHPEVFFSPVKEPHFFNGDMPSRRSRTEDEYLRLFHGSSPDQRLAEASVWYLYSKSAVPNILLRNPSARFIACVRDPSEMAVSLHAQLIYNGSESISSFEEAWDAQEDRAAGRRIPPLADDASILAYKEVCSNGALVKRLISDAPRGQVMVVLLDDLKADPGAVWRKICQFLQIDDAPLADYPASNVAATRKWPALAKLIRLITTARKKSGIKIPGRRLKEGLRRALDRIDRANRTEGSARTTTPAMRAKLERAFENDTQELERVLGRDLSHWRKADRADD
jgi:hypothetical protein